ncbi:ParA family protein [Aestuariibacter salexigens]|uniref:ParA family protein n=1 Tax=Aestuariibacter salexigens TaxID=226010 RepID=UPI0004245E76|nr:ParA family protein [Aestuariibacter salexigens]
MTRIVSCVNQKGGVGKTTVCVNMADALVQKGNNVLVIDMDPQAHCSQHFGIFSKPEHGVYRVIQSESSLDDEVVEVFSGLSVVPAGQQLIRLESVQMKPGRGLRLRKAIQAMRKQYDFILIDCPPSNGFLVVNAIAASQELLVPVTPDYFGLSGLSEMTQQIKRFERVMGDFRRCWILISRYQSRKVSQQAEEKIRHYFKQDVIKQVVRERTVLAECPGHGMPVSRYAPRSMACKEFRQAASQLLQEER